MAMTGGTAKLVHTGKNGATGSDIKVYVYYKISQDAAANKSTISLGLYFTQVAGNGSIGAWVKSADSYLGLKTNTFDGSIPNVSSSNSPYWVKENVTMTVNHNADGTGTATIYWKWGINSTWAAIQNPSGSFDITLPSFGRYTISYNANGGAGAPSSQSATIYNATTSNKFTLSSTKPTRSGYNFLGWTPDTATSLYDAIGLNKEDYPIWSKPTGAHDAYNNGDIVYYEGTLYKSLINGNIYSPIEYPQGWEIVK